jgi:hypothetical protein
VARRKPPPPPTVDLGDLPHALRRDVVVVEDFVPPWEMPPSWRANDPEGDGWWRRIRAMRRWQAAVAQWGAERGLSEHKLNGMGRIWPGKPPPFASERRSKRPSER